MKTAEPVDEYAETEVLLPSEDIHFDRETDSLSLYAEYERELAAEPRP